MPSRLLLSTGAAVAAAALIIGCGAMGSSGGNAMSFFITSVNPGKGGDLGGLAGADRFCQSLATSAGAGSKNWRAYLSTTAANGQPAVNARDRIGTGPWTNAKGVVVATGVADLHSANAKVGKDTSLTEKGEVVSGFGDAVNRHDILTGSRPDGTLAVPEAGKDTTCGNWTRERRRLRHRGSPRPQGHQSRSGCQCVVELLARDARLQRRPAQDEWQRGLMYCFAAN
jgi:hypothetical protein